MLGVCYFWNVWEKKKRSNVLLSHHSSGMLEPVESSQRAMLRKQLWNNGLIMLLYGLALEGVGCFSNEFWTYIVR